jgi:hypothetical protein
VIHALADTFPDDVRRFIAAHINSVEQLEVLLLLRRGQRQQWTADEVNREIRSSVAAVAMRLRDLTAHGLLTVNGEHYQYGPKDPHLDPLIGRLADLYRERSVSVITLIYAPPVDELRAFSDAFKLRKDR